jgi:2-keto-4-pentenoate hydratase/2-oxohepta-3-ene-1,7-dioic acid hydratase in catechol pathway
MHIISPYNSIAVCIGLNYLDHAKESGMSVPPQPVFFAKYPSSIIGPHDAIILPKIAPNEVDYEVELVIVIGKGGKNIAPERAFEHIVGWTVGHDVSARDLQLRKPGNQWIAGKTFDTFAPIGPAIVTKDEIENIHNLGIRCILNGQIVQNSNTSQLAFKTNELVAYLSQHFTFQPGDLIFTGTPSGVGFARKPPIFLRPGDVVVCEIDNIGSLQNSVILEV